MLHLSLLTLPRSVGRWRFMTSYQLHQILWRGFPGLDRGENENRFLYRHDERETEHSVLVQSATIPDWSFLADEAEGTTADVKAFDPARLVEGISLRFLLRANPVVTRKYEDGSKRRIAVGSDREQLARKRGMNKDDLPTREQMLFDWIEKNGNEGGFAIERGENERILCDVGPNHDITVHKPGKKDSVVLTAIDFTGILRVTDPAAFANTLQRGIGRGRAFGCGLISVRRA